MAHLGGWLVSGPWEEGELQTDSAGAKALVWLRADEGLWFVEP